MPNNPYIAGNPVGKTQAFIGRDDVLREVKRVIINPSQNAIALYGQRRIGKTSILQYLALNLPLEGAYKPVYFDLQDKAAMTLANVLQELARTIALTCEKPAPDLGEDVETSFRTRWLPDLLHSLAPNEKLVLLFDEFDILADPRGDQAAKAFFPYLRSLLELDLEHLEFIFVLGRRIDDLDSIALSVFKGISAHRVSLLTQKDTELLARIAERNKSLHWTDEALSCLWELTHGHPYLTQQLCSQIWDELYSDDPDTIPEVGPQQVEDSVQKTLDASRNALEWVWNGLPPAERVVISALAEAGSGNISQARLEEILHNSGVRVLIRELRDAPALLTEWDLIESNGNGDGYTFRVELLRRWLVSNKPLRRVQEELDRLTPVADGLYQAAQGMFAQGKLNEAANLLRQAVAQNPNHLRANELLSEILITQNAWDEARKLLEHLYEIHPSVARPRLAQVLIAQTDGTQDDTERLRMYDRILELEPRRYANLREQADKLRFEIRARQLASGVDELERLQSEKNYAEALILVQRLAGEFPEQRDWKEVLLQLEKLSKLSELYQRALGALNSSDTITARRLFAEVVSLDAEYEQAANYLNKAVTGVDARELQKKYRRRAFSLNAVTVIGVMILAGLLWAIRQYNVQLSRYDSLDSSYAALNSRVNELSTWAAPAIFAATDTQLAATFGLVGSTTVPAGLTANSIAFSPDGEILAIGSDDGTIRLWNITAGTYKNTLELHTSEVYSVAFSPTDSNLVAIGLRDSTVRLWTIDNQGGPTLIHSLEGHTNSVTSVAFAPDGTKLATGSQDGTVCLWKVEDGTLLNTLDLHTGSVNSVAFSPTDSNLVAIGMSDTTVRLWTIDNQGGPTLTSALTEHEYSVTSLAFAPDGRELVSGDINGVIHLWSLTDGSIVQTFDETEVSIGSISSIAFSPDGTAIASSYEYYDIVHVWSVADGSQKEIDGHTAGVNSVTFSPDSSRLATASADDTIRIWRLK